MKPILTLSNIHKSFRDHDASPTHVLKGVNLEVHKGEMLMLLGPSGSGKSTLLRVMSGLEDQYEGTRTLSPEIELTRVGFVFQQFAIFPWLTVYENIAFNLRAQGVEPKTIEKRVSRELERLKLGSFAYSRPRELSGGMKQRVGIARALSVDPQLIFLDEPLSELDSFTAEELRKDLISIHRDNPETTFVMVTHLISEALELGDRIAVLSPRPSSVQKIFHNKMERPRNKRSKEFFEMEDLIYSEIEGK